MVNGTDYKGRNSTNDHPNGAAIKCTPEDGQTKTTRTKLAYHRRICRENGVNT